MAGFEWNEFYTVFCTNMKKAYSKCTVGRYTTPKQSQLEAQIAELQAKLKTM